jgi:hypothetical protein
MKRLHNTKPCTIHASLSKTNPSEAAHKSEKGHPKTSAWCPSPHFPRFYYLLFMQAGGLPARLW